ncbi:MULTISPECIES: MBL fold metallo-hydrolase [Salinibaculum]|uniref:MBL fold metallo-hydrolase n=1 Tax=Salinibaculum TaxID=2732368 RepID=UPI0030CB91A4
MALGDLYEATAGETTDLYYVDTGMYDTAEYGSVYILDAERPALVDTGIGTNYEAILDAMDQVGIAPEDLEVIAPTHVHLDHAGGAGYLAAECPNADVYVYELGARHLVDPERLWEGTKAAVEDQIAYYAEPKPVPEERIVELTDGDTIDLGDHSLDVHHAPGHAPHQVVFHDPANDGVFTADAAGILTPGLDGPRQTSPPPTFDLDQVLADVEMLRDLDPAALYYGHFGDSPTADNLDAYAEVTREWVADVEAARERLADDEAVIEHFVERTEAVDAWGEEKGRAEERMNVRGILTYLDNRED